MRVALGLLIASASAALGIVESSLATRLSSVAAELGFGSEGELAVKGVVAALGAIISLWGIALGARRFRSAASRRLAIVVSSLGIAFASAALLWLGEAPPVVALLFPVIGVFLGLAAFSASNTLYNDVDFREWRGALAGYYIVSSLGSSMLLLMHVEGLALYFIPLVALASGLVAAAQAGTSPIPYTSLKVLENFADAAVRGPRAAGYGFKIYEIARAASALGALSAVKIALMAEAGEVLGPAAPLVFSASFSLGIGIAALEPSLTLASLMSIASLSAASIVRDTPVALAAVGVALGYSTLSLVYYVLDKAPRRLRTASVMSFLWTAAASIAVTLSSTMLDLSPALPALAIAVAGFAVAEKMRPRRPEWGAT